MRYDLAIFDFDGTLADTLPFVASILDELSDRFGYRRLAPGELEALRGLDAGRIVKHLGVSPFKLPSIMAHVRGRMAAEAASFRLFAGIDEGLAALDARGVGLSIVSSNAEETVRRVLGPALAGRARRFDCGASLFGKARKLRKVLRAEGVPPARAIYVGDELRDLAAAAEARLASGAVTWGYAHPDALRAAGPSAVFESVEAMVAHLAGA